MTMITGDFLELPQKIILCIVHKKHHLSQDVGILDSGRSVSITPSKGIPKEFINDQSIIYIANTESEMLSQGHGKLED